MDSKADEFATTQVTGLLTPAEVNNLLSAIMNMKTPKSDIQYSLRKLSDRASDLNYILPLVDGVYTYPDGSTNNLVAGKLYKPYRTNVHWTTEVLRTAEYRQDSSFLGIRTGSTTVRRQWTETVQHVSEVTKFHEVPVDLDPWRETEIELAKKGIKSFRFERIDGQLYTAEGVSLSSVMTKCEFDESFRRSTAVWLPVYEQKLTQGEILTKYIIYIRPYRGFTPVTAPRLYVNEELSYRTAWKSSELGELVHSINMGPGEERTITIEQSARKKVEVTRSTTSILDLTTTDSLELTTEIEKEASSTTESSRTDSLSASASGSVGAFGGSVSGSTTSTKTAKQFARQMERVARKAARNVTRNSRQEIRSSATINTEVSRSETTSINVKNINEGRTLNLLFYRLYNIFDATLEVENLQFVSMSGIEVVHGSGVAVPEIYSLNEIREALQHFDLSNIAYSVVQSEGSEAYAQIFIAYWSYLIDRLLDTLDEYNADSSEAEVRVIRFRPQLEALRSNLMAMRSLGLAADGKEPIIDPKGDFTLSNLYNVLGEKLLTIADDIDDYVDPEDGKPKLPLSIDVLRVASPGHYLDTVMGVSPATEPYAEEMRAQKVLLEDAEVQKRQAIARYLNSMSKSPLEPGKQPSIVVQAIRDSDRKIIIFLGKLGMAGAWELRVNGAAVKVVDLEEPLERISIEWAEAQQWLSEPESYAVTLHGPELVVLVRVQGAIT